MLDVNYSSEYTLANREKSSQKSNNLLKFLYKVYNEKGYEIFSDSVTSGQPIPADWVGPHPDLLVIKRNRKTAVCVETQSTLDDTGTAEKWEYILSNPKTQLHIVTKNSKTLALAKQLADENKCRIQGFVAKRTVKRQKIIKPRRFFISRSRRFDWILLAASIAILSVSILLFGPTFIEFFKIREYYSPFDQERQIDQLKKSLNDLEKKK